MLRFRLHTLMLAATAVSGVALMFRPVPIVVEYYVIPPADLPETVLVSGGLGNDPVAKNGEELYRKWHRTGWQECVRRFLTTPNVDWPHLDLDLASDDELPTGKYWLVDFERSAENDGFVDCRNALRELVDRYGQQRTREKLRVHWPGQDEEDWAEFAWEMGYIDQKPIIDDESPHDIATPTGTQCSQQLPIDTKKPRPSVE
ncbi:hypothetical protein NG895_13985 [Aeoliella sp. ICT_H6.2]|uniref:Uncharacterized protein n=1 Tax=Aeoliella straminimaris TaxID=2954799 RepID=A0A9X2F9Y5_9BACT|nr:hypothetical protein [Aeoliella straminimaris]MCO6045015.1 hypothetical protein [Aeoliella straminimaris]